MTGLLYKFLMLFLTFMKISAFNFGGGYAMISLIQLDVTSFNISDQVFNNIIAISQMTPGAISINAATYVGYIYINSQYGVFAGILGSLVATLAIPVPAFIIILFVSPILLKYKNHPLNRMIFYGLRAVVVGLVINAAIFVAKSPLYAYSDEIHKTLSRFQIASIFKNINLPGYLGLINLGSIGIFFVSLFILVKFKLDPILVILISAVLGMIIFAF